ncbi:sulfatase-like hydrolase/transferase [Chitinophaga pinensis]|uniref:Sulfatase n=1 Tax=Chitinophaga pinensis (strain ATCC 43595 / DSM 2588 / LMG 13176 / NBRC 15968 / NCIMB 11800 / UQM 2034) TaxID=485918 RepID=A0A979G8A5_CHIPD|nr:sulfatase-like hydrolase/transferase [Chitinophaga pinensis]ACU62744.1 sulfatase [Chitinophaga pinensis DSM 2588]
MKFFTLSTVILVSGLALKAQQPYQGTVGRTLADSKEWWPAPVKPAAGSPNVIWILLDDVGFGATSTFGGVISTPTFDSLANNGLRYTNFHTAAICAPTRAALMTGRNHHAVHMGGFAHYFSSAGFPGYDGRIPSSSGTIAEILKESGYNTFAVGKYGLTPDEDTSDAGPFDRWPSGKGFEHFFGFLGSETDQYKPALVEDNVNIKPDGRHLSEQITDKAISYIARQKKAAPDKPFFLYYAPGATHAPHQVTPEWSDRYKGKFDGGWDVFREQVFANQKKQGIIPANAKLPERNEDIQAWNTLKPDQQKLYARFMEIYAGYLTYTDHEVSRVINYLRSINQLDNTLIFVVLGDNGGSKEGTQEGTVSKAYTPRRNKGLTRDSARLFNEAHISEIGTPASDANYPLGWAQASNTPFKYWKQDANSEGGTRNPLIVFYPKGIKEKGIRTQYGYVSDLLPTTLEFLKIPFPQEIKGVKQDSLHGTSLVYSFENASAPSRHTEQYYYIFGSRAIYKDGWKAGAAHHPDMVELNDYSGSAKQVPAKNFDKDVWELYNLNEDFNERVNLAEKYPEKLAELKQLFEANAKKYNIYPFIDWEDVFRARLINSKKAFSAAAK